MALAFVLAAVRAAYKDEKRSAEGNSSRWVNFRFLAYSGLWKMAQGMMDSAFQEKNFNQERLVVEAFDLAGQLCQQGEGGLVLLGAEVGG